MPISDLVTITVTLQTAQALAAGFGVPMILGAHTKNTDRIRFYSSAAGVAADGFTTTDAEYALANTIFAQNPAPARVAIGRRANRPTMRWAVTPVVANATAYQLKVNGTTVTYTSDASATATEIIAGLKTAIDALALGVTTSDQTTYLRILANSAGAYFTVETLNPANLGVAQDHADAGVAADLDAISLVDSSWYAILSPYKSFAENQAIATWTETNKRLFLCETQDTAVITTVSAGATDIAATLKGQALTRTAVMYHQGDGTNAAAAWGGKLLPMDPGSETWKFKTLAGVTPTTLTETHLNNLRAKNCNYYYTIAGINMTADGKTASGEWIDTTRGIDWFVARTGERIVTRLANEKKIPYTNAGAAVFEGELRAQIQAGITVGLVAADPEPTVSVPAVSDQSSADRQARYFPNLTFTWQLAGAVHKVGVSGTVSP